MTRREAIERASVHHLYQYDYSYEEGEHLDLYIKGFTEGALWADEHPINVWHDASEIPQGGEVIAITEDTDVVSGDFDESRWGVFQHSVCMANWDSVIKWIYLVDFLDLILII